jgi:hypothetical protein
MDSPICLLGGLLNGVEPNLMRLGFLPEQTTEGEESDVFSAWNYPFGGASLPGTVHVSGKCANSARDNGLIH